MLKVLLLVKQQNEPSMNVAIVDSVLILQQELRIIKQFSLKMG